MVDCMASSTFRPAPLMAAVIRSCSISRSPDFTASGSILMFNTCLLPSIFTVTVPPPAEPSTTVSCIFFCRVSYCCLACDISSCRLNPPMSSVPGFLGALRELALVLVVNNRANLRPELFLHAPHHRVLLGAATAAAIARCGTRRRLHPSARRHAHLHGTSQRSAGSGGHQPLRIRSQRHLNHRRRRCHLDHYVAAFHLPLTGFKQVGQNTLPRAV